MRYLSIVVPVYSGQEYLVDLASRFDEVKTDLEQKKWPIQVGELIFVDDGAKDDSPRIIDELAEQYSWIVAIHHSRNFGQHPATITGILHSSGDWVATLDEDLQHPPEAISAMLADVIKNRSDILYVRAKSGSHKSTFRDASSKVAKSLTGTLSGNKELVKVSSFRILRGSIARATASVSGHDTYFDVALTWYSNRILVTEIEMTDERYATQNRSGYGLRTLVSHARRLFFTGQLKFLRMAAVMGLVAAVASFLLAIILISVRIGIPNFITVQGWTTQMLTTLFIGGLNLTLIGAALEYLTTLSLKANGRPTSFVIDRKTDLEIIAQLERHSNEADNLAS